MFHSNVLVVLVATYWLYSNSVAALPPHVMGEHKNFQGSNGVSELDCSQFDNDQDVLRQFPFPIKLNPTAYEYDEKSRVKMSEDGTFVDWITIKNEDLVPLSLFCLSNVTSLGIELTPFDNDIIPDALGNLKNLKILNIQSTPIRKITTQLSTLINLEVIVFFNCSLNYLPDINNLHKLTSLYLSSNNFIHIDQFQDLHLQGLDLSYNNLTEIPILKNKEDLIGLSLGNNPLKNAEAIISYPNLKYLYLNHARLTSIPSAIDQLQELVYLFISGNQLTDLPSAILNLPKLEFLDAGQNLFSPDYIQSMRQAFIQHHPTTVLII